MVALAAHTRPTILWGVPSYIRRLVGRAEEMGVQLPTVRLLFVTGEGFGDDARTEHDRAAQAARRALALGQRVVRRDRDAGRDGRMRARFGLSQSGPRPISVRSRRPGHQAAGAGRKRRTILLTDLDRRGTVMLRSRWATWRGSRAKDARTAGALTERIVSLPRRVDDLVKIKGMLVNPQALVDAVLGEAALLDFLAVVEKENPADPLSMDRLRLRIVPSAGAGAEPDRNLAARVQRAVGVTPEVERTVADDPLLAGRGWKVSAARLICASRKFTAHDLFGKPIPTPDQVRAGFFRDIGERATPSFGRLSARAVSTFFELRGFPVGGE